MKWLWCGITLMWLIVAPSGLAQTAEPAKLPQSTPAVLTLAEAIARARQEHPRLVAARERVLMAEGDRLAAGRRPNPTLHVSGENFPLGTTVGGFDFGRDLEWFAFVSQTFEIGGKRGLRQAVAARDVELAQLELAMVEREVVSNVKVAYERALMARAQLELARQSLGNFQQILRYNEVRVAEGYTAEGDLIKVQLETQRIEYAVQRAALEYEQAKIALRRAMGASSFDTAFELGESLSFQPVALNVEELEKAALRRPEVALAQVQIERARAALHLEQARAKPDITTSFGYKRNGPDNALYGAVAVSLPIFDRNQGAIARAQAEVRLAEAQWRQARNEVLAELAAARRAVESAEQQVESLQRDFLVRADASSHVALAAYREGAADLLLLLEAQRARNSAQELYLQALFDHRLAVHELERAAGIERLPWRQVNTAQAEPLRAQPAVFDKHEFNQGEETR